jgi:DNA-binding transcriptional ArsR family regulator
MGWIADLLKEIPSAARYKAELEQIERDNAALKARNAQLESELTQATQRYRKYELESQPIIPQRLDDVRERILVLLSEQPEVSDEEIAQLVQVGPQLASYHLEELKKTKYVHVAHFSGSDWTGERPRTEWSIAQAGRAYLHIYGLLR